jgi:hypothetical protein
MKSLKKLMSDTARAPYPTNLSGRNVKNEHVDDRKNKSRQAIYRYVRRLTQKRLRGKTLMYEFNHSHPSEGKKGNDSNLLIVFYVQIMPNDCHAAPPILRTTALPQ